MAVAVVTFDRAHGLGADGCPKFCYRLLTAVLSIKHKDILLNTLEGLEKIATLSQGDMPTAEPDFRLQDI
ncbi:hypothetical protein ACJ5NV_19295 [Loktanella agnita]